MIFAKRKKKESVGLIFILLSCVLIGNSIAVASARDLEAPILLDSHPDSYMSGATLQLSDLHPSNDNQNWSAICQSFINPFANYGIYQFGIWAFEQGEPLGELTARLYTVSGTHGSSAKPDVLLATSIGVECELLSDFPTYGQYIFTFPEDQRVLLQPNTVYCIGVFSPESGWLSYYEDYVDVARDTSNPEHDGNTALYRDSAWITSGNDMIFWVWGYPIPTAGERVGLTMEDAVLIFASFLLPVFILYFVSVMDDRKEGFNYIIAYLVLSIILLILATYVRSI